MWKFIFGVIVALVVISVYNNGVVPTGIQETITNLSNTAEGIINK
jgi:hypothetical protein